MLEKNRTNQTLKTTISLIIMNNKDRIKIDNLRTNFNLKIRLKMKPKMNINAFFSNLNRRMLGYKKTDSNANLISQLNKGTVFTIFLILFE